MEKQTIGIGITTRNRREVFNRTYEHILKLAPDNAKIVVIDDASDIPLIGATERFDVNKGIAGAKNACLRHLYGCDHIFLFDDDCFPIVHGWEKPYIESGMNHMCLSFELNASGQRLSHSVYVKEKKERYWIYNAPNGCMLYLRGEVLDVVGGMDERFGKWGHEHVAWSNRIHNAGLTPYPFMDVPNSLELFHVSDYYGEVESSVPADVRIEHIQRNGVLFEESKTSKEFIAI